MNKTNTELPIQWASDYPGEKLQPIAPEQAQSSPLPWKVSGRDCITSDTTDADGNRRIVNVAETLLRGEFARADAKLIVASVNHAERLAEALRQVSDWALQNYEPNIRKLANDALAAWEEAQS